MDVSWWTDDTSVVAMLFGDGPSSIAVRVTRAILYPPHRGTRKLKGDDGVPEPLLCLKRGRYELCAEGVLQWKDSGKSLNVRAGHGCMSASWARHVLSLTLAGSATILLTAAPPLHPETISSSAGDLPFASPAEALQSVKAPATPEDVFAAFAEETVRMLELYWTHTRQQLQLKTASQPRGERTPPPLTLHTRSLLAAADAATPSADVTARSAHTPSPAPSPAHSAAPRTEASGAGGDSPPSASAGGAGAAASQYARNKTDRNGMSRRQYRKALLEGRQRGGSSTPAEAAAPVDAGEAAAAASEGCEEHGSSFLSDTPAAPAPAAMTTPAPQHYVTTGAWQLEHQAFQYPMPLMQVSMMQQVGGFMPSGAVAYLPVTAPSGATTFMPISLR